MGQTNHVSIDFPEGLVVSLPNDWETWTHGDNAIVTLKYHHNLREGDYLHKTPEGNFIRAKTPKGNEITSHLIQAFHELMGVYIAGKLLGDPTSQTFLIKEPSTETVFTIGSVARTSWTVNHLPEGLSGLTPSQVTDRNSLKKNWITRIFLHDNNANPGHICLIWEEGKIEPYFVDYAICFTGHGGETYQPAVSGIGNARIDTWGDELIEDFTDPVVLDQLERIESLPLEDVDRKSRDFVDEIFQELQLVGERGAVEEDRKKSLEIIEYRMANIRGWVQEQKPRK